MAKPEIGSEAEKLSSLETPRNTATVTLPGISVEGRRIRLGMHTDSILTLLKTLYRLPDLDQVKVEGRVLTPEQQSLLIKDPVYRFYLSGRRVRVADEPEDVFLLANDINLNSEEVASLLQAPFTPSVLSDKIGYGVGYFSAKQMVSSWQSTGISIDLLPIIGGTNEFKIGSDTLSNERLSQITEQLRQAFIEQESSTAKTTLSASMLRSFRSYKMSPLLNIQLDINHPGQIKNLADIIVGETYREMHNGKPGSTVKILATPYQDPNGSWWVDVAIASTTVNGREYQMKMSLADHGVVPYSSNKWNSVNCLVRETPDIKQNN